ncbi:MAG: hypothetical protein GXO35_03465 [Gammaproteobacteria bacterium]|nr:hypothetical protein [Gammaproteobacteria bacterium]
MLVIKQESTKEPGLLGLSQGQVKDNPVDEHGQTLPKEASFSSLFASMFGGANKDSSSSLLTEPGALGSASSVEQELGAESELFRLSDISFNSVEDGVEIGEFLSPESKLTSSIAEKNELMPLSSSSGVVSDIESEVLEGQLMLSTSTTPADSLLSAGDVAKQQAILTSKPTLQSETTRPAQMASSKEIGLTVMDQAAFMTETPTEELSAEFDSLQAATVGLQGHDNQGARAEGFTSNEAGLALDTTEVERALSEGIPSILTVSDATADTVSSTPFGSEVKLALKSETKPEVKFLDVENMNEASTLEFKNEQTVVAGSMVDESKGAIPVSAAAARSNSTQNALAGQTHWGAQGSDTQVSSNGGAQTSSQSGQGQQGQSSGQQNMMFAQAVQEQRQLSASQQAAVKAVDEAVAKADGKDALVGTNVVSTERRGTLPTGLQAITQPIKHPQWGQALGQRVVFMANSNLQQAQITLNPEKLGHIQVVLQLDKDNQMNVSLTAQNGTTREAMESALPKLREMLEQAGVTLGSMDVSDERQFSESKEEQGAQGQTNLSADSNDEPSEEEHLTTIKTTDNIVDYYA